MPAICIEAYDERYHKDAQALFNKLQEHLVEIDDLKVQTLSSFYKQHYLEYVVETVAKYDGKIMVAKNIDENKILGLVAGIIEAKDYEDTLCTRCPKRGIVLELIVATGQRNAGCGKQLLNSMEEYFKERQCEFSVVNVFAPNTGAISFYQKQSYSNRNIEMCKPLLDEKNVFKRG